MTPKHLTADRMMRVALSELRTNPKLLNCDHASLVNAIVKAGQLGFEIGSGLGHAYLVPYESEVTLIVGYRGLIALARRSGEIQSLTARVVRERDVFDLEYGLDERLRHVPSTDANPGPVTHAYSIARLKDGGVQYEVMTRSEVESIRKRSRAGDAGPWVTDWEEMARKTVVRRLFKYLPVSIELADAVAADEDRPTVEAIEQTAPSALNARLAATIEQQPESSVSSWPQPHPETGELLDSRGRPWIEAAHSASQTCNSDGTWKRKRGVDPAAVERLERVAMIVEAVEAEVEQAPADALEQGEQGSDQEESF